MLQLEHLTAGYGKTRIVDDIDLEIPAGEVVALLGRNGMGKTTLLRSMFGLCDVFSGSLTIDRSPLPLGRPEGLARHGLSFMPDDRGVFPNLTVEENLRLARRRSYTPPVDIYDVFPLLAERSRQLAGQFSGGQKQQLGLARAMLAGERLIVVDEFSQGLQPSVAKEALEALRTIAATGVSVLIVEQGPQLPLAYADRILGMVKGRLVFDEPVPKLRADPEPLTNLLVVA
ncbi:ABC transporter ATP-binding protein [Georgenia thermotolerans]|uniref:ATP-binding cassette domain-containing protein n=1 Tax=Georgenia thermotolerans TaxID=527326 RepID=A0A7J5UUQ7_9MICO|nr:ATP-binding cassette domain-containing protein [Georgenia thermotolerans]KAE8766000.1 ATP-binding cassette domain-containing protein [Georgenia thermotolerans]